MIRSNARVRARHGMILFCAVIVAPLSCRPKSTAPAREPTPASPPIAADGPRAAEAPLSPEPVRDGPHGALALEHQLEMLGASEASVASAPPGVDVEAWRSLIPEDNAPNEARVALGRRLYFDPRLSKDGTVACATCHDVSRGFADRRASSEGIGGQVGRRNAPTTLNAAFFQTQFWDGRAATLEEQAKLPIINSIEMGHPNGDSAVAAISGDAEYQNAFRHAYGRDVNYEDIGRALATFERTLVFVDAPFDRFVAGDPNAMSREAQAGWVLFNGKARCVSCHQLNGSNPIGSNNLFHNIGVSARTKDFEQLARRALDALEKDDSKQAIDELALKTDLSELGRFMVTRNRADIGAFKTQQVRNVGITAPYMHDGSLTTLWDVMDHYNKGGEPNPYLDGGIEPLNLTEEEIDEVVAFLFSLTDYRFDDQNRREVQRQSQIAAERRPFRDQAMASRSILPFEQRTPSTTVR